ncbi:MAG: hypothetical protein HQM10_12970 [Candidatus Riflebacteria bacterium]|nr:hypothetical protein [Candidatus Riflebacteria bacterium]
MKKPFANDAYSLIEIIFGFAIMSIFMGAFWITVSNSRRVSADAYYETMATQLAKEPVEVFKCFNYKWLKEYSKHQIQDFPIGICAFEKLPFSSIERPRESFFFERDIRLSEVSLRNQKNIEVKGIMVKSTVRLKNVLSGLSFSGLSDVSISEIFPEE